MANDETRFKWIRRKKATEEGIMFVKEKGMKVEEATEKLLKEGEGHLFNNGDKMSGTRKANLMRRIEEGVEASEGEKVES